MNKAEKDRRKLEKHIEQKKLEIQRKTQPSTYQCNILLAHVIGAVIELESDTRFGQILRNLGIVKDIQIAEETSVWQNDFETPSMTFINRLGGIEKVSLLVKSHLKKHSGLKAKKHKKGDKLNRQEYNRLIQTLLVGAIIAYPEWSFGKILRNLELVQDLTVAKDPRKFWVNYFSVESAALFLLASKHEAVIRRVKREKEIESKA